MKRVCAVLCAAGLLLLCACQGSLSLTETSLQESVVSSSLRELTLCGETYPLNVRELSLDERFSVEEAAQLPYATQLEKLQLSLSAAYLREHGSAALDFMAFCPGITEFSLSVDLSAEEEIPLEVLTRCENLRVLYLSGGRAELSILVRCPALEELTLNGVNADLSDLAGMTLQKLRLAGYGDISGLRVMAGLAYLAPFGAETGFAALDALGLQYLNVVDTRVQPAQIDAARFASFETLETLEFSDASIQDISPLLEMENLKTLVLWVDFSNSGVKNGTEVTAAQADSLDGLTLTIPREQLVQFLQREDGRLVLYRRWQ